MRRALSPLPVFRNVFHIRHNFGARHPERIYEQAVVKAKRDRFEGMVPSIYSASAHAVPYFDCEAGPIQRHEIRNGLSAQGGVRPFIPLQIVLRPDS